VKKLLCAVLVLATGCATIFNSRTATIVAPPGSGVDGGPTPAIASQKRPHEVVYPDGRRCIIESNVSAGYVIVDIIFFWTILPLIIDAVTENWKVLDAGACPGVMVD
jgi:hypothetical protein